MRALQAPASVIAALVAGAVYAGEPINETRAINADGAVVIKNVKGEVIVTASSDNELKLTGDLGEGSRQLSIDGSPARWYVEVEIPRNARGVEETLLFVELPAGVSVDIEVVSARAEVEGLDNAGIAVRSVSGDVDVRADTRRLEVDVVSGDVDFVGSAADVVMNTVSGDVTAKGLDGDIDITSVSGEVLLMKTRIRSGRFESVSGDIELDTTLVPGGDLELDTLSGDIELRFGSDLSALVNVETYSGSIRSDRGEVNKARFGPNKNLSFKAGDGDARVRIESFSGSVSIKTD